jgi:hypothetical protein
MLTVPMVEWLGVAAFTFLVLVSLFFAYNWYSQKQTSWKE